MTGEFSEQSSWWEVRSNIIILYKKNQVREIDYQALILIADNSYTCMLSVVKACPTKL